jgi:S-adenosylmethionine-diacylgycerolhomoserine-N-methlytransferase
MSAQPPIDGGAAGGQQAAMDRMYRFQRHIYDSTRRFYLLGRERLISELGVPENGSVLEIGCGTGRNLVKVAQTYPAACVHGFDISSEMLKSAGNAIIRSGLKERIAIAEGDALTFDPRISFGIAAFDRVYVSYALSMIPQWQAALAHAARLVAPGGELHVADFGLCEAAPAPLRAALFWWLRQFHVTPRAELPAAFDGLSQELDVRCRMYSSYGGYAWNFRAGPFGRPEARPVPTTNPSVP